MGVINAIEYYSFEEQRGHPQLADKSVASWPGVACTCYWSLGSNLWWSGSQILWLWSFGQNLRSIYPVRVVRNTYVLCGYVIISICMCAHTPRMHRTCMNTTAHNTCTHIHKEGFYCTQQVPSRFPQHHMAVMNMRIYPKLQEYS